MFNRKPLTVNWNGRIITAAQAQNEAERLRQQSILDRRREERLQARAEKMGERANQAEKDYLALEDLVSEAEGLRRSA